MTPCIQKVLAPSAASSPATLPATSPAAEQYLFAGAGAGVAATNTVPDSPQRHALVLISATDPSIAVLAPTAVLVQASSSTISKSKAKKQKDAKKHVDERLSTVFTPALKKECRQRNLGVRNVHVNNATREILRGREESDNGEKRCPTRRHPLKNVPIFLSTNSICCTC